MTKKPRSQPALRDRETQFDIAAHKKEIDRLLRENAELKAKNLTLQQELALRPPCESVDDALPPESEARKAFIERLKTLSKTSPSA